jgi:branched-chain amino acid transport system permease protein
MNRILFTIALILLLALPMITGGSYYTNLASQILIAAIFAMSLNLLVGYAGLTSLGHAGYLGLAAYISSWLMVNSGFSHFSSALVGILSTTAIAGIFGLIALRATGISFLMITLAFGQILWGLAYRWVNITGGDNGISGLTRPSPFGIELGEANNFYYFALLVFCIVWLLIAILVRSPFGATIRGTKDQPRRMSALGFNVWLIRWFTFTACGFFGAIGGIMFVYYHQYISPHSLSLANSAEMLLMVIAGGAGTLMGPVIGAALVMLLKNVASQYIDNWVTLLGLVFIFIVMYIPGGIVAGYDRFKNYLNVAK